VRVVLAGGGTGGHVFPALAVADALRAEGASVRFVGAADGPEAAAVPAAGFPFDGLTVHAAQSRVSWATVRSLVSIVRAARVIGPVVRSADVVVSVGGYASAPAVLAARWASIPVVLVEPNSVPGVVNRVAARWATVAATAFDAAGRAFPDRLRVVRTGTPVRPAIVAAGHDAAARAEGLALFDLQAGRRTVLVVGGSQGARSLDVAVAGALPALAGRGDLQLLVSAGEAHLDEVRDAIDPAAALVVRAVPFIERMDLALAVTDLAVSRAGGSVAELAVCGIPAILVPYPHATEDHQEANARELVDRGAARLLHDRDLTAEALGGAILALMEDDAARAAMSDAMRGWARPNAADAIAALAREVAR
jgi:UDP-N-acetylglucosamine--N-acetylmuramyl-(pentapeptide) pyrophosphoryl-undecaprenol N-acetylglucosamine transferase